MRGIFSVYVLISDAQTEIQGLTSACQFCYNLDAPYLILLSRIFQIVDNPGIEVIHSTSQFP